MDFYLVRDVLKNILSSVMNEYSLIKKSIRKIPDFPVTGVMFRDVTTLMKDKEAFRASCNNLELSAKDFPDFEYIAGIESRGFVFGSVLAYRMERGFVLVRKPGKLPAEVLSMEYELEYGIDSIEIHVDALEKGASYLVVDDLLATGGTAEAACKLIESGGGIVVGCLFLVELPDLRGRQKLRNRKVVSIIEFEGE